MDALLQQAIELAKQSGSPYVPIPGRIAYLLNHGRNGVDNNYDVDRTQGIVMALQKNGLKVYCLGHPGRLQSLEVAVARLEEALRSCRPEKILAVADATVGLPAWVVAQRLKLPLYIEVRGFPELERDAREPDFADTTDFKAEQACNTFVASQADKVFTLSETMKAELARRGVDNERIELVPLGFSTLPTTKLSNPAMQARFGIKPGTKVIGCDGRSGPLEDLDTLIHACVALVTRGEDIKLILVGNNPAVTDALVKASEFGDGSWLAQVKELQDEHLAEFYALIDVLVIPRKPLPVCKLVPPMKAAEALAYGTRLVASNVPALVEYLSELDGVTTYEAGQPENLASSLLHILNKKKPEAPASLLMETAAGPMVLSLKEASGNPATREVGGCLMKQTAVGGAIVLEPVTLALHGNCQHALADIKVPTPGATLELHATVAYMLKRPDSKRKAVLLLEFFDVDGKRELSIPGIGMSTVFDQHFRYLNGNANDPGDDPREVLNLRLPTHIVSVRLWVAAFGIDVDEQISISISGRCNGKTAIKTTDNPPLKLRQSRPTRSHQPPPLKIAETDDPVGIRSLRVACIMDEFTYHSFLPEANLFQLTPDNWREELETYQPELLFVESAWRGKDGLWGSKVGHKSEEVEGILAWCHEAKVPTVFWNKEDPAHFQVFLNVAQLFDYVFTTDLDCIHRYKAELGHDAVYFLPLACQPATTNPVEIYKRKDAFCFAGAYYARYPDRTRDLETFVQELPRFKPLEIFDRNYGKNDHNYQFPERYQPYIVGTLPYNEIDRAYKGYRFAINLNSIKQSQTMFARRVYELLGSNTITVSNFSRGIRLMFGDLVIASDSGAQIAGRLEAFERNHEDAEKLRLAGLRKVLGEHTYRARLDYVIRKVSGKHCEQPLPGFTVVSKVCAGSELAKVLDNVVRQLRPPDKLVVILGKGFSEVEAQAKCEKLLPGLAVKYCSLESLKGRVLVSLAKPGTWLTPFCPDDYYGPNYLLDLALATRFTKAPIIGKAGYYQFTRARIRLMKGNRIYRSGVEIPVRAAAISPVIQDADAHAWIEGIGSAVYTSGEQQATDAFNYCRDGLAGKSPPDPDRLRRVREKVGDLELDTGMPLADLERVAERTRPEKGDDENIPCFTAEALYRLFSSHGTTNTRMALTSDGIEVTSILEDGKHEYIYVREGNELGIESFAPGGQSEGKLPLHLEMTPGLHLTFVLIFFDVAGNRLHHYIIHPNMNHLLEIPEGSATVRLGFRVFQSGKGVVRRLLIGEKNLSPPNVLGRSDVLVLTNNYPSYDDLYRNGFVHSRVQAYKECGKVVDVFRFAKNQPVSWHEFQGIDVISGSQKALDNMLAAGNHRHVLVHFLDPDMWEVLSKYIDRVKVTTWVHGAEVQPWYRREYNLQTKAQEKAAKAASEVRMAFWRSILNPMHRNLELVFVSKYFAAEVIEDVAIELPRDRYRIIHNPVNIDLFRYEKKPIEQRKKILSIRPFASRKYANDLTVAAIVELSKYPFFGELEFRLIGDGVLFEKTLEPVRIFSNVIIERRFVTQPEIASLHKEYGVFMCPTRMDSQGVSRDEAMASGLVPVTSAVAAIPEFVDATCGIVTTGEDYVAMAKGVASLYEDPELFGRLSSAAARRARLQVGKDKIVGEELSIILEGLA